MEKFKSLEARSFGAGSLTDQSAADKTHGLTVSYARGTSCGWEMSERLRKGCRLIVGGFERVYAVPLVAAQVKWAPSVQQEGDHLGRPSSNWQVAL